MNDKKQIEEMAKVVCKEVQEYTFNYPSRIIVYQVNNKFVKEQKELKGEV